VQFVYISFDHLFEHFFAVVGSQKRKVEILEYRRKYLAAVDTFTAEYLRQASWIIG